jgi:hypothetical protein
MTKGDIKTEQNANTKKSKHSYKRGFFYSLVGAVIFLIIPIVVLLFLQMRISVISTEILSEVQIFGTAISIVSFFIGYTRRDSRPYAGAVLFLIVLICAYFWYLLDGGVFDFSMQHLSLHLEFQPIMYWLLAIGAILAIPYILMLLNPKLVTESVLTKGKDD